MKVNEFKAEVVRKGMTLEEFADAANLTRTTLWRRLGNPKEFTLAEIKSAASVLGLSGEKVIDIFFEDKVS
jgi:transcriptional regulator with XRE-family HTH domain